MNPTYLSVGQVNWDQPLLFLPVRIGVDNSLLYLRDKVYLYQCDRFIPPEDDGGSRISGDPPLFGLQCEHARLYKHLQTLLQCPAARGRMAEAAMINTVPRIIRHPYLVWAGRWIYQSNLPCFLEELENRFNRGVIEGVNRRGSVSPLKSWWWNCIVLRSVLGLRSMRVTTIASASPPLVRPRGLIFEVELNFQLGPVSGLGHLFPCGDRGNPEPVPHIALQAISAELHLFFLREASLGSPSGAVESLDVLSDRLPFLLFYGGESNRGHFQIAVRETMQKPSFEVIPGLDTPGLEMFEPFESDSLEGTEE